MNLKKNFYFTLFIILLNLFLSIIPHLLVKPLWNMDFEYLPYVTLFEVIYTLVLLPIILIKLNKWISKRMMIYRFNYLILSLLVIIISILISNFFHYKNFGDMTGRAGDPDIGTRILSIVIPVIAIIIVLIDIGPKLFKESRKQY